MLLQVQKCVLALAIQVVATRDIARFLYLGKLGLQRLILSLAKIEIAVPYNC